MQLLVASMHLTSGKKDKDVKERKAEMEAFAPPLIDKLADYDAFVIVRDIYFFVRFFDGLFFSLLTTIDTPFCFPVLWCGVFFWGVALNVSCLNVAGCGCQWCVRGRTAQSVLS